MIYRPFGTTNINISALGFGCMRFPVENDNPAEIIEDEAIAMIRYAIDNGVNLVDTGFPYHGGQSEVILGKALKDGYRAKTLISDKLPLWSLKTADEADQIFSQQLKRLDLDGVDIYLLHGLTGGSFRKAQELGLIEWMEKQRTAGKIKYIGFSFHDDLDTFREIVDAYDKWDVCLIQYNYLDVTAQAGREGLKYAADKGLAVMIMEPLRGGLLADKMPDALREIWDREPAIDPVTTALKWLWDQQEIAVILSGMSTMGQVIGNIAAAGSATPGCLTPDEKQRIGEAMEKIQQLKPIRCTGCNYCMPCPNRVWVPQLFDIYNNWLVNKNEGQTKWLLGWMLSENRLGGCDDCGGCEDVCPQHLPVRKYIGEIMDLTRSLGLLPTP